MLDLWLVFPGSLMLRVAFFHSLSLGGLSMAYTRILQARLLGRLHGQQTVNVLNFGSNEAAADNTALIAILVQLGTQIILCVTSTLVGGVTSDWTLETVETKQLYPTPSDPVATTPPAGTVGEHGPTSVSFAAALVNIRTGGGGKRGRGRIFLPPPGEAAITDSIISDTPTGDFYASFLTCMFNKYGGAAGTENQEIGVLSRRAIATGTAPLDALRPATSLEMNTSMSVLRSRKVGSGG
jgi:hypothetical protein